MLYNYTFFTSYIISELGTYQSFSFVFKLAMSLVNHVFLYGLYTCVLFALFATPKTHHSLANLEWLKCKIVEDFWIIK